MLVLAVPYVLHFDGKKIERPVVRFTYRFWRIGWLMLISNGLAIMVIYSFIITAMRPESGIGLTLSILLLALPILGVSFVFTRLHFSYWQHERQACFVIDQHAQQATYTNANIQLQFALSDVTGIVEHVNYRARNVPWSGYTYHIFTLRDGRYILVTNLLHTFYAPDYLFPSVRRTTARRWVCWLPGDDLRLPRWF